MKRFLTLLAFATLTGVAAPNAHAQTARSTTTRADSIQAGTYDLEIAYGGGTMNATLAIAYVKDSITAVLKLGEHDSPVRAGARHGNKLTLEPATPGVDVLYQLEFVGATVKGTFRFNGTDGTLTGKLRGKRE